MSTHDTRTAVITGAGGVGKTTLSAALGIRAASLHRRTLVLTVDPARRLADALDIASMGDAPIAVAAVPGMWAAMLDVTASWEAIIHRYAEPEVADRLLVNPFFRAIADRFPAAQSFAAAEAMADLIESGHWDQLIIDTPPSAGGLDFFLSPARVADLIGGKLLHWLTGARFPARRALYRITARPMLRIADVVLGGPLLEDVAEFLFDLRTMYDGLEARSRTIQRYLREATTLVVTTADPAPAAEALRFFDELSDVDINPTAILLNRALPLEWADAANRPIRGVPDAVLRAEVKANLKRWGGESRRQASAMEGLAGRFGVPLIAVPWMATAPTTVDELRSMIEGTSGLTAIEAVGL